MNKTAQYLIKCGRKIKKNAEKLSKKNNTKIPQNFMKIQKIGLLSK